MADRILVAVRRHPDYSNTILVDAPEGVEVTIVDMDLGSEFDGYPRNEEEGHAAQEMADDWERSIASLTDEDWGDAARLVASTIDEMRQYAETALAS